MNSIIKRLLRTEMGRRIEIQTLMQLVTSSLGLPRQNLLFMPSAQSLERFAAFTAEHLVSCNEEQQQRLHTKALSLGKRLRQCLTRRDDEALSELTFQLYQNIGIQMEGRFPEEVIVRRCYFCQHYSPQICSLASLMDDGIICGLFGGGRLVFSERITEGKDKCRCVIKAPSGSPKGEEQEIPLPARN